MEVNDSCSETNLRIGGILGNSKLIFDPKDTQNISSQLSKIGLVIENSPLRSYRVCRKCCTIITRLLQDTEVLEKWIEKEKAAAVVETCHEKDATASGFTDKRDREPTPSKTPRTLKKSRTSADLPVPPRTSVTEVGTQLVCLSCYFVIYFNISVKHPCMIRDTW